LVKNGLISSLKLPNLVKKYIINSNSPFRNNLWTKNKIDLMSTNLNFDFTRLRNSTASNEEELKAKANVDEEKDDFVWPENDTPRTSFKTISLEDYRKWKMLKKVEPTYNHLQCHEKLKVNCFECKSKIDIDCCRSPTLIERISNLMKSTIYGGAKILLMFLLVCIILGLIVRLIKVQN
jgi:hypothetical protein